jgi:predicted DNA-binding transcriptional regulator AlpA
MVEKNSYLTAKEAAKKLSISVVKWRCLSKMRDFPVIRMGRNSIRVNEKEYTQWVLTHKAEINTVFTAIARASAKKRKETPKA